MFVKCDGCGMVVWEPREGLVFTHYYCTRCHAARSGSRTVNPLGMILDDIARDNHELIMQSFDDDE